MIFFAKDNPSRPLNIGCSLFLIVGYALYFAALYLPTPQTGRELIDWLAPTVKALQSAARVGASNGTDPFAVQIVILYCASATVVLTGWCLYWHVFDEKICQALFLMYQMEPDHKKVSRFTLVLSGVAILLMCIFCLYIFFWTTVSANADLDWRTISFYSSQLSSITFLLITGAIFPGTISFTPGIFYAAFHKNYFNKKD